MNHKSKRHLGKSGIDITVLGFGGAPLGDLYAVLNHDSALQAIEAAYGGGVAFFDTAPFYGHGLSEYRFGTVLNRKPRGSFILATKVGRYLVPPGRQLLDRSPFAGGLDFNHVFDYTRDGTLRSIEQSMARLGISTIDCLIIHDVDVRTHGSQALYEAKFKEAMAGAYPVLDDLRSQGIVKAIGVGVNEVDCCMDFASAGDFDFFLLAGRYTLLEQGALETFLPMCQSRDIGVLLGGPYNSGILATGAVEGARYDYRPAPQEIIAKVQQIEAVCSRYSVPLAAAALQFPLGHPSVTCMIPGAASPEESDRNIALMTYAIPGQFWDELKTEGLLEQHAPTPSV
jgi:D-threo-aldose 1-dehydrogenase